jgi:hypothetical protein
VGQSEQLMLSKSMAASRSFVPVPARSAIFFYLPFTDKQAKILSTIGAIQLLFPILLL